LGFRVQGLELGAKGVRFWACGAVVRVWGSGFGVQGCGNRGWR
jgi:hypothetical protein